MSKATNNTQRFGFEIPSVNVTGDGIYIDGELIGSIDAKEHAPGVSLLSVVTVRGVAYDTHPAHARELALEKAWAVALTDIRNMIGL